MDRAGDGRGGVEISIWNVVWVGYEGGERLVGRCFLRGWGDGDCQWGEDVGTIERCTRTDGLLREPGCYFHARTLLPCFLQRQVIALTQHKRVVLAKR